jgi:hypothetical protein
VPFLRVVGVGEGQVRGGWRSTGPIWGMVMLVPDESVFAVSRYGDRWSVLVFGVRELSGRVGVRRTQAIDEPTWVAPGLTRPGRRGLMRLDSTQL